MDVKDWAYEEFPDYTEETEGAVFLKTTGDEQDAIYEDFQQQSSGSQHGCRN